MSTAAAAGNTGANYIGRYELKSKSGEGASGVVYRAYDPLLDRDVANPDEELLIVRQSPTRLSVIPIDETVQRIARIIGDELTVPSQAEPGVREAITNIAPMLTVHSEVAGMSDGLEEAQADSTLYLHILPAAEGLSFEMFNHPFGIEGPGFKPGEGAKGVIAEVEGRK